MERSPEMLDFVIGLLQIPAVVFLTYGAYLAVRRTGARTILAEPSPGSASLEKKLELGDNADPPRERRSHTRRKTDRRAAREGFYGLAR
jgi:hypothetical protein